MRLGAKGSENLKRNIEARQRAADAFANRVRGLFDGFAARGLTHRAMASELNGLQIAAPRGGQWTHGQVQRLVARLRTTINQTN